MILRLHEINRIFLMLRAKFMEEQKRMHEYVNISRENNSDEKRWSKARDIFNRTNQLQLGSYYSHAIHNDIKHFSFTLSRYKFVAKLLMYKDSVDLLELGCQEGLGALMFEQNINLGRYVGVDLDQEAIEWNKEHLSNDFEFDCANFLDYPGLMDRGGEFDAVVSLDVIEHIDSRMENKFCEVISSSLKEDGIAIIGTPNIMMSPYVSEETQIAHINLYD